MKKRLLSLTLAVLMVFSLIPATVFAAETAVDVTVVGTERYDYCAEVFTLVNDQRTENGVGTLTRNATLSELAMQRAAEIAIYYEENHLRPDDTECDTIADGVYSGHTVYGENIALGQSDPEEVIEAWMNSEGHRDNILDSRYTQIGIGCFVADGYCCWVQIFSNSTTDTATTSATGSTAATRTVSILPSNLDLSPSGTKTLELTVGETSTFSIVTTNPGFTYIEPTLIPTLSDVKDSSGNVIATVTASSTGVITVTAKQAGTGSAKLPVYASQSDALTLSVTVKEAHTHSYTKKVTDPTCTEKGYTTYTCSCGDTYQDDYTNALGHNYQDGTCTRCGAEDPDYVAPTEHTHSYSKKVTDPTCTEKGYTTYTCSCGDTYQDDYTNALGHNYQDGTCTRCGAEDPDYVAPTDPPATTEPEETTAPTEPEETTAPTEPEETEPPVTTEPEETEPPATTEPEETEPTPSIPTEPDDDIIASGTWGENVTWTLDKNGVLTISGQGPMAECDSTNAPWDSYKDQILSFVVEEGVTNICDYACYWYPNLKSVYMADSVTEIGYRSFEGCGNLTSVTLSKSLTEIPCAFSFSGITEIVIPDGATFIASDAFYSCEALVSVSIPKSVTEIGEFAFRSCTSLTTLDLPDGLTRISWGMFEDSGLVELEVPASVTEFVSYAFNGCSNLKTLIIPDSVTSFGDYVFDDCPNLTIYTYLLSYAHAYAEAYEIPVVILDDEPDTVYYPITVYTNDGGSAVTVPESSPANRYVLLQVEPDGGYEVDQIYYYYNSEEDLDLQFEQISDTEIVFFMPACEVGFEIYFVSTENPFVDVSESSYYYQSVLWAVSNGVTSGISANRFGPNNPCTRAQVMTFLWRAAGSPEPESLDNPFTDVKESDYYYKAVLWAVENGITSGVSATRFGPGNVCTRAQVVTFLWRLAGSPDPYYGYNPFVDVSTSSYYYKAVLWAVECGITSGVDDTHFGPSNTCTRGQIVTFLYKAFHG